jgi:hypothetical protein
LSSIADDVRRIQYSAEARLSELRRVRDRLLDPVQSVARLFMDEKDGKLRAGAGEWLERLARENFVSKPTLVPGDREQSLINEGRRLLALDILKSVSLDCERLENIEAQIMEIEHAGR